VERVKRQLSEKGLMPEDWGGDTVMVEVSAKTKKNIPKLLEMILLVGDLRELKADPDVPAKRNRAGIARGQGPRSGRHHARAERHACTWATSSS
jgi:translation initiation factor IF-2